MKKIMLFTLSYCGFCQRAMQYVRECKTEFPEYKQLDIEIIDESEQKELARTYQYYYVPTFYIGLEKVHEGPVSRQQVDQILRRALECDID